MNAQKMTQKSLEALQAAQSLAVEYENQALCPEQFYRERSRAAADESAADAEAEKTMEQIGMEKVGGEA